MEFPSIEQAKAFYRSPDYARLTSCARVAGTPSFVAIDGYDPNGRSAAVAESRALAATR
jgi:hypothetical protein